MPTVENIWRNIPGRCLIQPLFCHGSKPVRRSLSSRIVLHTVAFSVCFFCFRHFMLSDLMEI